MNLSTFVCPGLSTTLIPVPSSFSQSIISYDNLVIDCNSPQAKVNIFPLDYNLSFYLFLILFQDIYCDNSMMDVNIKHFLFRDGTQVWIAPSFHFAGISYS